jgi:hypothetical protein
MNHQPTPDERTRRLIAEFIDGDLSATDAAELNQLLKFDPQQAEHVVDQLLLDSLLSQELGSESLTALVDLVANEPSSGDPLPTATASTGAFRLPRGSRRLRQSLGGVAVVAALLVAFLAGRWENSALASAATVVRAAMETHAEPVERVYIVQTERSATGDAGFNPPRDVRVATQGDRFYVEMNRGERRWLVIERDIPQHGTSTVTFTLVDSRTPDESKYRPEGHLIEPFRILTRETQPDKRRELMTNWFGPAAERWIKTSETNPQ